MAEEILVNVTPREVRVALLENGVLQEIHIERKRQHGLLGNIYKGKVTRLMPGIQAAFIDIGLERAAFLHVTDMNNPEDTDIRDLLHSGQDILVQVYKNPIGSKGARLTTQFTIPSRYLVLTPNLPQICVSQKITDEDERNRLLKMITTDTKNGYIFRTAGVGITQEEVDADKEFLSNLWSELEEKIKKAKACEIIYEEIPIVLRVLRDLVGYNIERIRVDNLFVVDEMKKFATRYMPNLTSTIEYYQGESPIFDIYSVEGELQKALERKVYLKSGGHLVFDQTEAMTTIDVNTGSYLGSKTGNLEQTIFKTNLEAVEVISRQVRLRNLGGIIIIDFIDMMDIGHKEIILETLSQVLAKDPAKTQVSEISSLGLVQMTRKRAQESLEHILCETCPLCQKRGLIKSVETICYDIFRELKRVSYIYPWAGFLVLASENVVNCLLENEASMLTELQEKLSKPIKLQIEPSFTQENYNILPMPERG